MAKDKKFDFAPLPIVSDINDDIEVNASQTESNGVPTKVTFDCDYANNQNFTPSWRRNCTYCEYWVRKNYQFRLYVRDQSGSFRCNYFVTCSHGC